VRKPIGRATHAALDYGLAAVLLAAPRMLGLDRRARTVAASFGVAQGCLNALTDQPLALRRQIPFARHGRADLAVLPATLGVPLLAGSLRDPRARVFFLGTSAALAVLYALTDWTGPTAPATQPRPRPRPAGSADPDTRAGTAARNPADSATPADGPADAAGPTTTLPAPPDGPRRPSTVDTAPSIREQTGTTHAADTGAQDAGTVPAPERPADLAALARERMAELPAETASGRRDPDSPPGAGDPADYTAEHKGRRGR
jgi:hypothetical protein